ncbi:long-chain fatty acid--CoA ligase [Pseudooceanicola sediminis]|uniref:Long-chain fatty acid--CoA ligase n=1 Tax=Pseudooceanicola sediminis TaxID=2211117 RepID=A0A399J627_9RHOB|nr:class I adenylate-forming enzyme family protein [Pseudooceanicola sediminis]KAA2316927.1 acyl--CoA ligase [Puniceibacterium sp. HSS470]RII40620.1 long-chain fatty acid--CoA ligase [Pseudooceanicola sediminis]|tara:strand:+ start:63677 stop:65212 length:1536 start_codon:yes stop_codon:yes gene_type:complete
MQSVFDQGACAPCPASFNLAAYVLAPAATRPDKLALAILGAGQAERWTFARLEAAVRGTATGLLAQGLAPGDLVVLRLGNTVDFPIADLGAIAAGLVPVPTSAQLTAPEVARMIASLRPAAILHAPGVACPQTPCPVISTSALRAMRDLVPAPYAMGDPDRLAYVVFTSGTSGRPRAVAHAHRAIWARRMMHHGWYGLGGDDRLMHAGAFNWTFTLGTGLMDPWSVGATALIPATGIAPHQLPGLMQQHEVTLFAAAPGVYRKILQAHPRIDLPHLRHGLAAGEKLSATIREGWRKATGGGAIHEAFGMSECSTFISASPASPAAPGALGAPQQGRRVALLAGDGTPVPLGAVGTIAVHASDPGLMLGYLNAPEDTAARYSGDWFVTGDLGTMDASGQITYQGRADDMMNAGGYRVSPIEVEAALADLPGITEIGVTEVEVKTDARLIVAFYTGPQALPDDMLHQAAATRLARYKQPRAFLHVSDLPRNPNGKLQRRALGALWEAHIVRQA